MLIKEVTLYTSILQELKQFYTHTLEFKILLSDNESFSVNAGSSVLTFKVRHESDNPFYHFAFNIPENKFKESKEWIVKKGAGLITLDGQDEFDFRSWNAHSIYFYDPAGNILEFIARHNLDNASGDEFSGRSILSISEIGLPVYNVKESFEQINSELGIPEFSGDGKQFLAAGDENGLFIIVPKNRRWFPDCDEAGIFPEKIVIHSYCEESKEIEIDRVPYSITNYKQ